MEQYIDRSVVITFNDGKTSSGTRVIVHKVVYDNMGRPLYIQDTNETIYNWNHILKLEN